MDKARIVFCEPYGRWSAWVRGYADLRIHEVRSMNECWEHLSEAPASFVVVELTACPIKSMIEFLVQVRERSPLARVVAVGSRAERQFEWLLREAGAVAAYFDPQSAEWLARQAVRHFDGLSVGNESVTQQIFDRLPWADFADAKVRPA